ncbi:MAG TPA: prolyl oligopeptidase family serine peptidase [Steroidobacteraceae bacterium]|jgi:dipeptidyl aminopeptidase/acylaminoacyl peptidase|nr:prolyl oligopeptidase family serine peptidase [Steroidobacteraceae bacterium]
MKPSTLAALIGLLAICAVATAKEKPAAPATPAVADDAALFGTLEKAYSAELSADGKKLVFVGYGGGASTIAVVVDLVNPSATQIARGDGQPTNLNYCQWTAADRLVCALSGLVRRDSFIIPMRKTISMNADGSKQIMLGQRTSRFDQLGWRQSDGHIVDWMNGTDGTVLMARTNLPEISTGNITAHMEEGLSVERIDTRTGKATTVERPATKVDGYISDGLGNVRLMTTTNVSINGDLRGVDTHFYRLVNDKSWRELGTYNFTGNGTGMVLLAVDPIINAAYVLQPLDGRDALYRISLDSSLKSELVFASKKVDVDGVIRVGRGGRVIGASYTTDLSRTEYFDPTYRALHEMLSKALPKLPLITFYSASADEQTLLIFASSDVDPGHWYVFDRTKKTLVEAISQRAGLKGKKLSPVTAITFPAADGTEIPAYLTLPPGVADAKGLPAIVMPHGGPAARDEWGFDWLAQFFAQRGFVVLQPNFRGSAGYGDQWFVKNGFQSWKISIGDICDGGRWLVKQGYADSSKLAIFGWSYGGYAALQSNVMDPNLFKAVVAVAPVADLALLKNEAMQWTSWKIEGDYIGSGPHIKEGSPAQNASAFVAPVLMFHGDRDLNVDIDQSRRMYKELHDAGKSGELIVYPELDHSLRDENARADMLRRSEAFLRKNLKL